MRNLLGLVLLTALSCCAGGVQVGPFYPRTPHRCAADPDCAPGWSCRFPEVDKPAICMATGYNEADQPAFDTASFPQ